MRIARWKFKQIMIKDVIHFMLPEDTVMQVADQVNKNGQATTPLMTFTLQLAIYDICFGLSIDRFHLMSILLNITIFIGFS
ncbi:MAG: hypothetical protein ACJ71R_22925 [Nitrososphaeraceae archaeon]